MKRFFDILFAFSLVVIFLMPMILIGILIRLNSKGPSLYWSTRIGQNDKIFRMPKFRSMFVDTPSLATDLMKNPDLYVSNFGKFIRKYSIDELPQLFSILKGDMSFVGPRPALYNQHDLIKMRQLKGINMLLPGVTGWAQINGRDEISIEIKVKLDEEYLTRKSFLFDLKIILKTFKKVFKREGVVH
jgi:O-antigen biosynthesis protein WbqP